MTHRIGDKVGKIIWTYKVKEDAESMKEFLNSKYITKILYKDYGRRTVKKPVRIMQTKTKENEDVPGNI